MISAGEFKNGITFELDNSVYQVIEFQHVKPGKGPAFVRTKLKNILTGALIDKTFNPTEKFNTAFLERKNMQYLYFDSGLYYFMDNETYEQTPIDESTVGDCLKFVKENMDVKILFFKGNVIGIEPPIFVELEVIEAEPGIKGNTASNVTKAAKLETGAEIRVPMFVEQGNILKVDTRTGQYIERV